MTHWCIIPARTGSRRIPHKNTREFHGAPILDWTVRVACYSGLFDHVFVSTDDRCLTVPAGAQFHERTREHARDEVGTLEVTQAAADELGVEEHDFVCCLYPCAGPFVTPDDLGLGEALVNGRPADCAHAFAVGADPLRDAGQWYWSTGYALAQGTPLVGHSTRLVVIPSHRVCDINTEADWTRAEDMYRAWQEEIHGEADEPRASVGD